MAIQGGSHSRDEHSEDDSTSGDDGTFLYKCISGTFLYSLNDFMN